MLVAVFGVLDAGLSICAGVTYRSPFVAPVDKRQEADKVRLLSVCGKQHRTHFRLFLLMFTNLLVTQHKSHASSFIFTLITFLAPLGRPYG